MNPAERFYLEHLTERDLALLAQVDGTPPADLRSNPAHLAALAQGEPAYEALFDPGNQEPVAFCSPALVFSTMLGRAQRDLAHTKFIPEWVSPGRSVPLFDVEPVQIFLDDPLCRLFLVELMTSYTHVNSGNVWRRTPQGWRRQRYSELDPVALAQLLEGAPEMQRLAILRRLGDASLFLSGIFPDHTGTRLFTGPRIDRLERAVFEPGRAPGGNTIELLEQVGMRAYRTVAERLGDSRGSTVCILESMAASFREARRFLNLVTARYLHPLRTPWFGEPGH